LIFLDVVSVLVYSRGILYRFWKSTDFLWLGTAVRVLPPLLVLECVDLLDPLIEAAEEQLSKDNLANILFRIILK